MVCFFLAESIGRIANEHSSTPAEIGRGCAGVVCIVQLCFYLLAHRQQVTSEACPTGKPHLSLCKRAGIDSALSDHSATAQGSNGPPVRQIAWAFVGRNN